MALGKNMQRNQERKIEYDCHKLIHEYYQYVDRHEFESAAGLFTTDVLWLVLGVKLQGRTALLTGLNASLSEGTIRHVVSNCLVDVIDERHVDVTYYLSIYHTEGIKFEDHDGPLPFEGPHRIMDQGDKMVLTKEGWRTAYRWGKPIFRRDLKQSIPLEIWAGKAK